MGYDLHITRREDWSAIDGPAVAPEEWLKIIESDPELRLAVPNGEYFAIWTSHPKDPEAWIDWSEGNLYSKNPDVALIRKMEQIAYRLQARVVGDDGEEYHGGRVVEDDEDGGDVTSGSTRSANARALGRLALLYILALILMALLGVVIAMITH